MKKLALVTVIYNSEKNLSFFLPSIKTNLNDIDAIFFVNNNSTDNSLNVINSWKQTQENEKPIEVINNKKNIGYAGAVNIGIQKAIDENYDYILVTGNDIIFNEGFFSNIKSDAGNNKVDALGVPASVSIDDIGFGYVLDTTTNSPKKVIPTKRNEMKEKISANPILPIDFPHGGTILFSKHFFSQIGLYDKYLFFGGDELDFLYRVAQHNRTHPEKIKCAVSLQSFELMDNLTKHNTEHRMIKARGMLQGNARVNLKHKFNPLDAGLYKEQYSLIKNLSRGKLTRYIILYLLAIRGTAIEIARYYESRVSSF